MLILNEWDMDRKVFQIEGKFFLVQSELKLSTKMNIIGFWSNDGKTWAKHVSSVDLSMDEYSQLRSFLIK